MVQLLDPELQTSAKLLARPLLTALEKLAMEPNTLYMTSSAKTGFLYDEARSVLEEWAGKVVDLKLKGMKIRAKQMQEDQPRDRKRGREWQAPTRTCHNWARSGSCSYGNRCRFSHDQAGPINRPASPPRHANDAK